ncbi:MAG: sugar phosphate nucleotidyltransferase [Deltaproteobacteria bacterium]|nr:sugar phosphate nucleotidyltransferase [Deltaproteobacteria bacterium]
MRAMVLAGGRGTRLRPYTTVFPKPLMPLDDVPILDVVLRQLVSAGFRDVTLSVGYLAELIRAYCGDGSRYGISLKYLQEDQPLGTVGSVGLLDDFDAPILLMNGDILTDLSFEKVWEYHHANHGVITVALNRRPLTINFGVIDQMEGNEIRRYVEKPTLDYLVGMGICVIEPAAKRFIARGERMDLPDLIAALLAGGQKVVGWETDAYWLDIGRPDDYERAQADFERLRDRIGSKK